MHTFSILACALELKKIMREIVGQYGAGTGPVEWAPAQQVPMPPLQPYMDVTGYKPVLGKIYGPPQDYTNDKISFNGTNRCYHTDESTSIKLR